MGCCMAEKCPTSTRQFHVRVSTIEHCHHHHRINEVKPSQYESKGDGVDAHAQQHGRRNNTGPQQQRARGAVNARGVIKGILRHQTTASRRGVDSKALRLMDMQLRCGIFEGIAEPFECRRSWRPRRTATGIVSFSIFLPRSINERHLRHAAVETSARLHNIARTERRPFREQRENK